MALILLIFNCKENELKWYCIVLAVQNKMSSTPAPILIPMIKTVNSNQMLNL